MLTQIAKSLNEKIKQVTEVKEYLKCKEIIVNDKEMNALLTEVNKFQYLMKEALKKSSDIDYLKYKNHLQKLKKDFSENPDFSNYFNYKEDTADIVLQISNILGN